MADTGTNTALRLAIQAAGYYPDLVADTLETALAGEPVDSYIVHHEPHFDRDELRRHVSVLVLTPTRLVVGHTDEYPSDDANALPHATTSTEAVPLDRVASVVVSRTVTLAAIKPTLLVLALFMTIWALRRFEIIWILTQGGPAEATNTLVVDVYRQAFRHMELGPAAAVGMVGVALSLVVAGGYMLLARREERRA